MVCGESNGRCVQFKPVCYGLVGSWICGVLRTAWYGWCLAATGKLDSSGHRFPVSVIRQYALGFYF